MIDFNQSLYQQRQDDEQSQRTAQIKRNWEYYQGDHPRPLTVRPGQVDDNTIINLCKTIVDKGISLLFGKPVSWQVDEGGTEDAEQGESPCEAYLQAVWKANKQAILLHNLAQNGGNSGHVFVKLNPLKTFVSQMPGRQAVQLINLDPATVTPFHEADDINTIWRFRIQFNGPDRNGIEWIHRQDIDLDAGATTWVIRDYKIRPGQTWGEPWQTTDWKHTWPPIVHCQNLPMANAVWGLSDLEEAALNDATNLVASSIRKILRLHGFPLTVIKNAKAPASVSPDRMMELQGDNADVFNLEMQSDLASAETWYDKTRAAFFAAARMVDLSTFQGNLGAMTNFGLRVLYADALAKTDTKRALYGVLIEELNQRIAEIGGFGPDVQTTLTWADPLPTNSLELAQEVTLKQPMNIVSSETLTTELGYNFNDEQQRLKDERDAGITPPLVDPNAAALEANPAATGTVKREPVSKE